MNVIHFRKHVLQAGVGLPALMLMGVAAPAVAQQSASATAESQNDLPGTASPADAIVVTGTRINSPNLTSANPVAIINSEQIFSTGNLNVGDQLNELPQFTPSFSQANSTRFLGTRGLNLVDLRGLDTQRTLVLVNGRRHVASDVLSNGVSVDINTIPTDLIERVDILTGGASAIYGSDAIAGVVNFVLKDDYEGVSMRAQAGMSDERDAEKLFASVLAGQNFADGRGNITFAGEYSFSNDFYASQRRGLRNQQAFVVTDTDPAGTTNGADGVFDRTFYQDVRSATISLGGLVAAFPGAGFTQTYLFQPDGSLAAQTGQRIGIAPNGNFLGGNGMSGREGRLVALSPQLERYTLNLTGHYEISPAFVPFFEAKYTNATAIGSQSGPFFSQGTTIADPGNRERVRLDNPYLQGAARTQLASTFAASTVNVNTGTAFADITRPDGTINTAAAQLAAQRTAIANGSFRFNLRRNWTDFGTRDEEIERQTYRFVAGVRGDFNDDWSYEISANYGEHKENNRIIGNVNAQRYALAIDTTRDAAGNVVCRSSLNPAGTLSYLTGNPLSAGDDPRLAADIAACVPLNPFGQGSATQQALDYILVDSLANGKITQFDAMGFVSGDFSQLFELPGGPVAFSLGAEYRRETLRYDLDDLTQEGYAFYNAIPTFEAPSFASKEVYGELYVPLLADMPFFEQLSLRGNARLADYKGATGSVWAYGAEAVWSPVQDITLRGTYARSVRAPNLNELYSAVGQNFAPGFVDPCSERNLATGSATRAANCAADGRPAGYDFVYISSLEILSGGNEELLEETSDSYTAGVILQPRWIPGLSISADYFNIQVNDVIASATAQQIANLCYDSPTLDNAFCDSFERAGAGGGPNEEIPFQILESSLLQSSLNFASLKREGIDTQVNYNHTFGFGRLDLTAYWSHYFTISQFTNPSDPDFENVLKDELPYPSDQVNVQASLKRGPVRFTYGMRWLDKMYLNTYEDYNSVNGLPPQNADYAPITKYPDIFYHDFRLALDVEDSTVYVGVDNITDEMPPYGLTGVGFGSGIYSNTGRYFYLGLQANF